MSSKGKVTPKWNLAFSRKRTVGLHRAKVARVYKGTPSLLRQLLKRKHRGSRQRSDNTYQMSHAPMLSRNMMDVDIGQLGFISVVWRVKHYLTWMKSMKTYDTWQWKIKCGAWSCHKTRQSHAQMASAARKNTPFPSGVSTCEKQKNNKRLQRAHHFPRVQNTEGQLVMIRVHGSVTFRIYNCGQTGTQKTNRITKYIFLATWRWPSFRTATTAAFWI